MFTVVACVPKETNNPPTQPSLLYPEDGDTGIPLNVTLSWEASDPDGDTLEFDLYFGEQSSLSLEASNLTTKSYEPLELENEKTYYWKVVAKDPEGKTATSNVWSFTTKTASPTNLEDSEDGDLANLEDFEDGDLEHEFFNWVTGGDAVPFIERTYEATVLRFGDVDDNEQSWIETSFTLDTVASLSFKVKVSSEANWDFFKVYIDGVVMLRLSEISSDWMTYNFELDQGNHTVRFAYEKDDDISHGYDTAWLDDIVLAEPFGISGEITINDESIPVFRVISGPGSGYLDEYGGLGVPWTIF